MRTLYLESSELASELKALLPRLSQRDLELSRRMRRSAEELSTHAEESMLATGRMRRFELRAAEAAAVELRGCLRAAHSNGYLQAGELAIEPRVEALRARLAGSSVEARGGSARERLLEARGPVRQQEDDTQRIPLSAAGLGGKRALAG